MADVLTRNVLALIQYLTTRIPIWNQNFAEIGLEQSDVTAVSDAVSAMNTAQAESETARAESKAKTLQKREAFNNMYDVASLMVKKIKTQADSVADPSAVYAAAKVDMPNPPSPRPAPPVPVEVNAVINQDGNVDVKWKGAFGQDVFFEVKRQLVDATGQSGPWTIVSTVGEKKFTDTTLPVSSSQANYTVTARRNDKSSATSEPAMVRVGTPTLPTSAENNNDESMPMAA